MGRRLAGRVTPSALKSRFRAADTLRMPRVLGVAIAAVVMAMHSLLASPSLAAPAQHTTVTSRPLKLSGGSTGGSSGAGGSPAPAFVTRCGTSLCSGGTTWRLHGASVYGSYTQPSAAASLAQSAGLNTVRLTNFLAEHGSPATAPYAEASWQQVDAMIAAAGKAHLEVILDLSTYRNLLANAGLDPYAQDWQSFVSFVTARRNTVTGVTYG